MFDRAVFADGWGGPVIVWLRHYGWAGVDLFFILSGFVFAHVYRFGETLRVDGDYVETRIGDLARNVDLSRFIL